MKRLWSAAPTLSTFLVVALPLSVPCVLSATDAHAAGRPAPAVRSVGQVPGHPLVLYPGREGTAAAYCPQGMKPTGGGATVESDLRSAVFFRKSAPDAAGNRWVVQAYNASDEVQTVHPRVICTTDSSITQRPEADVPLQPGESVHSAASCGNARYAVGGGFEAGSRTFVSISDSPDIRSWSAMAKYTDYSPDAPPSYLRTFVVCSDTEPVWRSGTTATLAVGEVGMATAECPAGQVPLSGGGAGSLDVLLTTSAPTATGWTVWAKNTGFDPHTLFASVMCAVP